jgi:hypothetical protein
LIGGSGRVVTLGLAPSQQGLFGSTAGFCRGRVGSDSVYGFLHPVGQRLLRVVEQVAPLAAEPHDPDARWASAARSWRDRTTSMSWGRVA